MVQWINWQRRRSLPNLRIAIPISLTWAKLPARSVTKPTAYPRSIVWIATRNSKWKFREQTHRNNKCVKTNLSVKQGRRRKSSDVPVFLVMPDFLIYLCSGTETYWVISCFITFFNMLAFALLKPVSCFLFHNSRRRSFMNPITTWPNACATSLEFTRAIFHF